MAERLSEEAKKMCAMCIKRGQFHGDCNVLGINIETQNELAQEGLCIEAMVSGLGENSLRWTRIFGQMRRLENGQWVFEGRDPYPSISR